MIWGHGRRVVWHVVVVRLVVLGMYLAPNVDFAERKAHGHSDSRARSSKFHTQVGHDSNTMPIWLASGSKSNSSYGTEALDRDLPESYRTRVV